MEVRLPVTWMPVLFGAVPGVTFTVSTVFAPESRLAGFAAPVPEIPTTPCTEMSSMASACALVTVVPAQTE